MTPNVPYTAPGPIAVYDSEIFDNEIRYNDHLVDAIKSKLDLLDKI
jgi:hypothetical protein